jgi:hypothetical protein
VNQPTSRPMTHTRRALRVLALLFVLALAVAAAVWQGLQSLDMSHVRVILDGDEVLHGAALGNLSPGQHLLALTAMAGVCFALMVAVPVLLLTVAIVVLPILLLALGLPLVVVLSIGALLMAPLALVGLLCWWLIRAVLRDSKPGPSATMTA